MTVLEGATLSPVEQAGRSAEASVGPSPALRGLMWACVAASIIVLVVPRSAPLPLLLLIDVGVLAGWIAFFAYRWQKRRKQRAINAAAAQYVGDNEFVLYLRPFMTSGRLPVPCLLPRIVDRWLMGKFWDLELALSLSVGSRLVAIGSGRGSFGAAKLSSSDEAWRTLVDELGTKARLILLVPFNRPGTLWETLEIWRRDELLRKTVFVMPPTNVRAFARRILRPWHRTVAWMWKNAQGALAPHGLHLPDYSRRGGLIVYRDRKAEFFEAQNFHPNYFSEFCSTLLGAERRPPKFEEAKAALSGLAPKYNKRRPLLDYVFFFAPETIILSLGLALLVRFFLFQPFNIPSGSMIPTLLVGDYLFASKYSYGYSQYAYLGSGPYTLPFGSFTGRVWSKEPERGDVVVFRLPRDNATDYIKRVIGLPGDEIQMIHGVLNINGRPVSTERIDDFTLRDWEGREKAVPRYRETLPNGVSYPVLDLVQDGFGDNTEVYKVPEGHLFMMGDNRDNSTDSRFLSDVGFVPFENLVGKAQIIFFSMDGDSTLLEFWHWPTSIRWPRIFHMVH